MTQHRVSFAQNGEDVRVWRAFRRHTGPLSYVDVGANDPRELSITASLYDLGWRGILIEADPELAAELRARRPDDIVVAAAAAEAAGERTFFRVPGTGLGTLDSAAAQDAAARGFAVAEIVVPTRSLDAILEDHSAADVHFMCIDVEGAEADVLRGLDLHRHRPWVLCVEAVLPGSDVPSHGDWEERLLAGGYQHVAFDGVNRWYVADEHSDLGAAVATPFNAIDAGEQGWVQADVEALRRRSDRAAIRHAWQRELILHDVAGEVPAEDYEAALESLRESLSTLESSRSYRLTRGLAKAGSRALSLLHATLQHLPAPVDDMVVRRRHLRMVGANMGHLTDPAFLGHPPAGPVDWIAPDGLPPAPVGGLTLGEFTTAEADAARAWLDGGPYDSDELLDRRTDNHGDQVGRATSALRLRLMIADRPATPHWAGGHRVLVDARCLQTAGFGARGIGRFAKAALLSARATLGDDRIDLLVDRGLEDLPESLAGGCRHVVRVSERSVAAYSVLLQLSPMTASPEPLLPILHSTAAKVALVFDVIPLHFPTFYLGDVAARAEYAASLDALRLYDECICISDLVRSEVAQLLAPTSGGRPAPQTVVAWPAELGGTGQAPSSRHVDGPIVVMTGDDGRKNTFGALAGVGTATSNEVGRDVVVVGMAGHDAFVHHLSISAAMRPGEVRTAGRIDDAALADLLGGASAVVVASFDEGLSLPVIEAIGAGVPVVASDIPAHRELLGRGSFLADPRDPRSIARAVRRHRGRSSTAARQRSRLAGHAHVTLEDAVATSLARNARSAVVELPSPPVFAGGRPLRVGIATPWPPQRSGVADYSAATISELATLCDVTVYTTSDADVAGTTPEGVRLRYAGIDQASARAHEHDVFVSVVGNSHFHLPMVELLDHVESVVIAHDTRMVELYLALRDRGGLEKLMLRGTGRWELDPPLDEQIDDMRLLQNAGFWEVARRARVLVTHSPTTVERLTRETGVTPHPLLFANYRTPDSAYRVGAQREQARARLGFDEPASADTVHLATFGFVDVRTKQIDTVVEAAAWLTQWGHRVSLHIVGSADPQTSEQLARRASEASLAGFEITGFVPDDVFRDYLLAVDLGLQLRISPLLGVSGPLSDMAAYGTPALGSSGLARDVDTPGFIDRLPDDISPVTLAEALEFRLAHRLADADRETMRVEYLQAKSPRAYAQDLLAVLTRVARTPMSGEG